MKIMNTQMFHKFGFSVEGTSVICCLLINMVTFAIGYNEHPNFCIQEQESPLPLNEIENMIPKERHCQVVARTMTKKEKESFIDTMCTDHDNNPTNDHQYFKLHNGELNGRGSYHDICEGVAGAMFAWVPYEVIEINYASELNPQEHLSYIAKATNVEQERTDLCHFRHSDLVNNISNEYFTCTIMISEDNYYRLEDKINVLVEIEPLMYELSNLTYSPWRNVTNSYKSLLGKSVLKNMGNVKKPIYGSLKYAFVEKIRMNLSAVFKSKLSKLPLLFEHRYAVLELDTSGVGGMDVKEKAYFGRIMDPRSEVKVDIIGQWVEQTRTFTADIYEYFGYGIKLYKQPLDKGEVVVIGIDSTEPVFEAIESSNLAKATIFQDMNQSDRLSMDTENATEDFNDEDSFIEGEDSNSDFFPWFVIGCIIFAGTVVVIVYGIVHLNTKKKNIKDKTKYELTCNVD